MSLPYKPKGIHGLPPPRSKVTSEEMRFASLAGRHHGTAPAPFVPTPAMMPLPPFQFTPAPLHAPPAPWLSGSNAASGGLIASDGSVVPILPSSSPYVRREFSVQTYCEVKRHVNHMLKNPCEKTFKYKFDSALDKGRSFLVRTKWKVRRYYRQAVVRVRQCRDGGSTQYTEPRSIFYVE
ncbi:hypothetical protein NP233_g10986 [Leucocoprinus birnbaumii]|uniref:Uncharacterized protein n=1 Tax=Leucocoprinus birnbaumii TaxID=56174 RepID=A0AAD5VHC3_9AGAR|nr:hypothetical protein NP233_g10986 [Leucocoprinus birnbaumii]